MENKDKNKNDLFSLTELHLVMADINRTYIGELTRSIRDGLEHLFCQV
jgi:hypothetical protein